MQQLRFTAVHEDGQHLVLSSSDGTEMLLAVDERLRAALRPRPAAVDAPATELRPRHVQAMIRAGQNPAEVAEITGWPAERVARFEGPILAEREHVAGLARAAHVRGRGADGTIPTLESRVRERLTARGVDADNTGWDATRPEGGSWTVLVTFVAGQRQRSAAWLFDPADRTVEALDDEARWLSEDEQALPGSAAGKELFGGAGAAEEVDLMTTMREHSRSRGRRKKSPTASADPAELPSLADAPEQVLPLEELAYDPDSMGLPPAARGESPERSGTSGTSGSRRRARKASARKSSARKSAAGEAPDEESTDQQATDHDRADARDTAPDGADQAADGATTYDIELDFDDDYEVDPSPQEATLADLFGHEVAYDHPSAPRADDAQDSDEDLDDDADEDLEDDLADDVDAELDDEPDEEPEGVTADAGSTSDVSADDEPAAEAEAEAAAKAPEPAESSSGTAAAASADDTVDGSADGEGGRGVDGEVDGPGDGDSDAPAASRESTKAPRRKDGRPGVPSWDDIMFGAKDRGH